MTGDGGYAANRSENVREQIVETARQLRRIAADVERRAELGVNLRTGNLDHADAAYNVLHDVTWGYANLNLDRLARTATEADLAAAMLRSAPAETAREDHRP